MSEHPVAYESGLDYNACFQGNTLNFNALSPGSYAAKISHSSSPAEIYFFEIGISERRAPFPFKDRNGALLIPLDTPVVDITITAPDVCTEVPDSHITDDLDVLVGLILVRYNELGQECVNVLINTHGFPGGIYFGGNYVDLSELCAALVAGGLQDKICALYLSGCRIGADADALHIALDMLMVVSHKWVKRVSNSLALFIGVCLV